MVLVTVGALFPAGGGGGLGGKGGGDTAIVAGDLSAAGAIAIASKRLAVGSLATLPRSGLRTDARIWVPAVLTAAGGCVESGSFAASTVGDPCTVGDAGGARRVLPRTHAVAASS